MDQRRNISIADGLSASARAAAILAALSMTGCAALCSIGTPPQSTQSNNPPAHASRSKPASHRPPAPSYEDPNDDSAGPAPQLVNVFGEVNGASPRSNTFAGDVAFQQHTFADEGYDADIAVDSTAKWLVYASTRNSEHPSIYLQRVGGTAVTQLTDGGSDDSYPVFSPDGKQIAFSSTRSGNWQIYTMDVDGRNVVQLTSGSMQSIHPSFSPDGTRMIFCSIGGRSGQWELWTLDLKTSEKRMIGYGVFPAWSPDRTVSRIAFQRARQRGSHWFSLWTIDLVDGEGRRPTEVAVSNNAAILSPSWSPDGKQIAFTTVVQAAKGSDPHSHAQTDVWTIDADGSNRQRLTDGRGNNLMPFFASDHRVYFISDRGGTESVWSVRADPIKDFTAEVKPPPKKDAATSGTADSSDVGH